MTANFSPNTNTRDPGKAGAGQNGERRMENGKWKKVGCDWV